MDAGIAGISMVGVGPVGIGVAIIGAEASVGVGLLDGTVGVIRHGVRELGLLACTDRRSTGLVWVDRVATDRA